MTAEADGAPPPLLQVLDSHIHLWPSSHLSPTHHGWMTPGHQLARRHGLTDYAAAVCASSPTVQQQQNQRQPHLLGVVYVETDRYLPSVWPRSKSSNEDNIQAPGAVIDSGSNGITRQRSRTLLEDWAKGPLDELRFLRRIVEGNADADVDGGSSDRDGPPLLALVVWAPLHLNPDLIKLYLEIAEEVAGEKTWARIAGFRYLIQGIRQEEEMKNLVESPDWLDNLRSLSQGRGGRGWSFDVGVDVRSGGVWQVEVAADMVGKVRERERKSGEGAGSSVRFILNHLCKPDLKTVESRSKPRWTAALGQLAQDPAVYMKFSGSLNEFGEKAPESVDEIVEGMRYYAHKTFELFGPRRIMFGSDWPVCNLGGPTSESSWGLWKEVVERWMKELKLSAEDRRRVWYETAAEAYGIDIGKYLSE